LGGRSFLRQRQQSDRHAGRAALEIRDASDGGP
jgi:hypothetical protein